MFPTSCFPGRWTKSGSQVDEHRLRFAPIVPSRRCECDCTRVCDSVVPLKQLPTREQLRFHNPVAYRSVLFSSRMKRSERIAIKALAVGLISVFGNLRNGDWRSPCAISLAFSSAMSHAHMEELRNLECHRLNSVCDVDFDTKKGAKMAMTCRDKPMSGPTCLPRFDRGALLDFWS